MNNNLMYYMKTLFEEDVYEEIKNRFGMITPATKSLWGKMNVAQMMAHCKAAIKVPLDEKPGKRIFMGILIGWILKPSLHNDKKWSKNLPTAPDFLIQEEKDFIEERIELLNLISAFHQKNAAGIGDKMHPFFGKLTAEQWGKSTYKHLDHHLRQFGV